MTNIQLFLRVSVLYLLSATFLSTVLRDDAIYSTFLVLVRVEGATGTLKTGLPIILALLAAAWWTAPDFRAFCLRLLQSLFVLGLACLFLAGFSTIKSSMPLLAETLGWTHFFADHFFAKLDNLLHFGVDPWTVAHAITHGLGLTEFASQASVVYGLWWAVPAFYLPAIVMLMGDDHRTARHFILLYFMTWIVLGNVLAFLGLSAGPVFYDALFDTQRYAALHESLALGGLAESWMGNVQGGLWHSYSNNEHQLGTGISAFPSLHMAMATVTVLYARQKGRVFAYGGYLFLAAIFFISVWSGYHYAVDGYASVAVVLAMHVWLKNGVRLPWRAPSTAYATPAE